MSSPILYVDVLMLLVLSSLIDQKRVLSLCAPHLVPGSLLLWSDIESMFRLFTFNQNVMKNIAET